MIASCVGAVQPLETVTQRSRVVRNSFRLLCSDSVDSDDDVLSVGAVRPLTTAAPLGGARMKDDCQLHADATNDVLSVGAGAQMNRPGMCCARLDDFDWVGPPYEPDMVLAGRDIDVDIVDIRRDIRSLPDVFPVMVDKTAAVPKILPVGVEMGPQVDEDPVVVLTGPDMEVSDMDVERDVQVLTDVCPMMFDESATEPLSLPVVVNTETQVDVSGTARF